MPPPGDDRQLAETVARIFARPLDRARPLWELYLIHGLEGGRVALLTKIHHSVVDGVSGNEILGVLLDPSPEGARDPAGRRPASAGERVPGELEMLGRGLLGAAAPAAARAALAADRAAEPDRPARARTRFPGVPTLAARATRGAPRARLGRGPGVLEVDHRAGAADAVQRAGLAAPALRVRLALARHRQGDSRTSSASRSTTSWSRCAPRAVRDWLLERDELPDEPLVAMVPVSVRTRGADGHVRQPGLDDDRPDPDQRGRPARAPACAPTSCLRSAKERHSALPADLLTDATSFIPPAVAALRGAHDDGHPRPHAPAAQPRDLQRARPARARSTARARSSQAQLPGVGRSSTASGST